MPQPKKPARLYLEPARLYPDGRVRSPSVWVIRDGSAKHSTGSGATDHAGAETALRRYLSRQHAAAEPVRNKTAADTMIADVVRYYLDAQGVVARPKELAGRIDRVLAWWGRKSLDDVNGHSCRSYVAHRGSPAAARRELEDLRAAIKLYCGDGLCREYVAVKLPEKPRARMSFFTRYQIAALLRHVWTAREVQKGHVTDKRHLRHVALYVLLAVYTGTRSARIWTASFEREAGRPWIDLDSGIFYREAAGEMAPGNKRAEPVRIPERLLAHLRRWQRGPLVDGVRRPRRYACEFRGKPGDPKKAIANAMEHVFGKEHPFVRHTFRHTCATWLMWAGEDVGDIASYMSMTREMVVLVYGKEHPDADRSVGRAFSEGRAGRRPDKNRRQVPAASPGTDGHSTSI